RPRGETFEKRRGVDGQREFVDHASRERIDVEPTALEGAYRWRVEPRARKALRIGPVAHPLEHRLDAAEFDQYAADIEQDASHGIGGDHTCGPSAVIESLPHRTIRAWRAARRARRPRRDTRSTRRARAGCSVSQRRAFPRCRPSPSFD